MKDSNDVKIHRMDSFSGTILSKLIVHECKEGERIVFNIANDFTGRTFIEMLRKALNRETYTITVRGSQSDRKSYKDAGINLGDQSVPLKYADRLRVYIDGIKIPVDNALYKRKVENLELSIAYLRDVLKKTEVELGESEARVAELEEEIRKIRFGGLDPDQVRLCMKFENDPAIKMAQSMKMFGTNTKIMILKAFNDATGLGLKNSKMLLDKLVFND